MLQTIKMVVAAIYVLGMLMSLAMTIIPSYGSEYLASDLIAERVVQAVAWPLTFRML